ncbi:hypothetical protein R3P38DRAFT_2803908 [Favolaschia claudopus]|uniref:Secreted protein n=1 Tax=Favolaschia claudopus TaxID=2862362 RepID=A0AAV9ZR31_9AGAR
MPPIVNQLLAYFSVNILLQSTICEKSNNAVSFDCQKVESVKHALFLCEGRLELLECRGWLAKSLPQWAEAIHNVGPWKATTLPPVIDLQSRDGLSGSEDGTHTESSSCSFAGGDLPPLEGELVSGGGLVA